MIEAEKAAAVRALSSLRVVLEVTNRRRHVARTTLPMSGSIAIGRESLQVFQCHQDPMVCRQHGTLEMTAGHHLWVYVDHSEHGTRLNDGRLLHEDAVVVRHRDSLQMGDTEIIILLEERAADDASGTTPNQASSTSTNANASPASAKAKLPSIVTSSEQLQESMRQHALAQLAQNPPPMFVDAPMAGNKWRRKRHSMTAMMGRTLPDIGTVSASQSFGPPRSRAPPAPPLSPKPLSPKPPTTTGNNRFTSRRRSVQVEAFASARAAVTRSPPQHPKAAPAPPLEYSCSPMAASVMKERSFSMAPLKTPATAFYTKHKSNQTESTSPPRGEASSPIPVPIPTPVTFSPSAEAHPFPIALQRQSSTSRRDELRIQVSKKMAGAVGAHIQVPSAPATATPKATTSAAARPASAKLQLPAPLKARLGFTPPASPVAHQDIIREQQSLLQRLQTKQHEEQMLKKQQEEWMRQQRAQNSPTLVARQTVIDDEDPVHDDEPLEIPPRAPILLRTVSLGVRPNARSSAAEDTSQDPKNAVWTSNASSAVDRSRVSVDSSVCSSASTVCANYRRVTRSRSFDSSRAASSGELHEFFGYDDDPDSLTSFTTHAFLSRDQDRLFEYPASSASMRGSAVNTSQSIDDDSDATRLYSPSSKMMSYSGELKQQHFGRSSYELAEATGC